MKNFAFACLLAGLTWFRASAQVTVEISSEQDEFLPGEAVPLAVKITNLSGQQLHFGADAGWLTFSVESVDGFAVVKNSEVPVQGQFDLFSSQAGTKIVDVEPYFQINRTGRYKVTAILHMKDWATSIVSQPKAFDVVSGARLWSQNFGLPAVGGMPEMRQFSLVKANYLRSQLRLYAELSDASESRIFKVLALGPMVSFGYPEAQIDRTSQLHVLWQTGAQSFSYSVISTDGVLRQRDTYDNFGGRPKLKIDDNGDVLVVGGVKRVPAADIPEVRPPDALPPMSPN